MPLLTSSIYLRIFSTPAACSSVEALMSVVFCTDSCEMSSTLCIACCKRSLMVIMFSSSCLKRSVTAITSSEEVSIFLKISMVCSSLSLDSMAMTVLLSMTLLISATLEMTSFRMVSILWVADADSEDRELISSATTANPLPASPALAASMAALRARRFVCLAIWPMLSIISTIELDFCASSVTPSDAVFVEEIFSSNFLESSRMALMPSSFFSFNCLIFSMVCTTRQGCFTKNN